MYVLSFQIKFRNANLNEFFSSSTKKCVKTVAAFCLYYILEFISRGKKNTFLPKNVALLIYVISDNTQLQSCEEKLSLIVSL